MAPRTRNGAIWIANGGAAPPPAVCANAVPTPSGPGSARDGGAARVRALGQRVPHLAHEPQIEVEIVERGELRPEHLARHHEVAERAPAEVQARVAGTSVLDRARVARM